VSADTVYLVWTGDYSDKDVEAAYLDPQQADQMAKACGGRVEPLPLGQHVDKLARGLSAYTVYLGQGETRAWLQLPAPEDAALGPHLEPWSAERHLRVHCWAKDEAHAIKIASDLRAEWQAAGRPYIPTPWPVPAPQGEARG
jgi:hypothetical protein